MLLRISGYFHCCYMVLYITLCAGNSFFPYPQQQHRTTRTGKLRMAQQLDALGRLPKEYRQLTHPFGEFTDRKFQLRYRVTKDTANDVIDHMREVIPEQESARGGGLSLDDKVCTAMRFKRYSSFLYVV